MATNYNNAHMEYCNCANFQWSTRWKHFQARRLVSYLLINNSYNVVAIELQLMIVFSLISSKTATNYINAYCIWRLQTCFFFTWILTRRWLHEVSCSDEAHDDTPHSDTNVLVSATWKFVLFQYPCRPHCYACAACSLEIMRKAITWYELSEIIHTTYPG